MSRPKDNFSYAWACKSEKHLAPDWRERLLEEFEDEAPDEQWPMILLDRKSRSAVWSLCERMGVPYFSGIAPQACRIYEKYLFISSRRIIASHDLNETAAITESWEQFKSEIMGNLHLLIISSIQLATKYNAGLHITASKVRTVLGDIGINHTLQQVIAAEFEVFRTIGFRVPLWTSLEVAELLAQEIGLNTTNAPRNYRVLALVMDVAEFYRNQIEIGTRWITNIGNKAGAHLRTLHLSACAVAAMSRIVGESCDIERLRDFVRAPMLLISSVTDVIISVIESTDKNNTGFVPLKEKPAKCDSDSRTEGSVSPHSVSKEP